MDLHTEQIQGFFNIPVDNIYSLPIMLGDVWKQNFDHLMVVSPTSAASSAPALAKRLECDLAIIDKRRPKANVSEVMNIIGEVEGRTCVIMDDMVDTAGTLCKAATALKANGASRSSPTARTRYFPARPSSESTLRSRRTGRHRHHSAARRCALLRRASASCRSPK
jgi:ribose-phosphate pyrophosphokinase